MVKNLLAREQDGRGVGGCGVHLSPWIHQEYTFRHRSACRTPAESRQEYLTSGKEYIEIQKNLRSSLESLKWEHWLQDPRLPENWPQGVSNSENSHKGNHWNIRPRHHATTLCRTPHLNNKQNTNTNPIISRQDYHPTQPCPSQEKQTNKQQLSTDLTLYDAYTNHWTNLRRAETKRKKEFSLEAWEKETSITVS